MHASKKKTPHNYLIFEITGFTSEQVSPQVVFQKGGGMEVWLD